MNDRQITLFDETVSENDLALIDECAAAKHVYIMGVSVTRLVSSLKAARAEIVRLKAWQDKCGVAECPAEGLAQDDFFKASKEAGW